MKNLIFFIFLALTLSVVSSRLANAQATRLSSSPQNFRTFFAKFRSAVEKSDKKAVAGMTRFPFKYGFDAGDEGTMSKAQFLKRFSEIFGKSPKQFLTEKDPLFSVGEKGDFVVSTEDAAHLIFVKKGDSFNFAEYIVEP